MGILLQYTQAIFYLLKGNYRVWGLGLAISVLGFRVEGSWFRGVGLRVRA